ncbi:MAG: hypothetical protein ACI9UR_001823 [Bacteroidia bacterium]|jgi:hypothetical protein
MKFTNYELNTNLTNVRTWDSSFTKEVSKNDTED